MLMIHWFHNRFSLQLTTSPINRLQHCKFTCAIIEACFVKDAREELQPDDGVDEDDEDDEESDVQEGDHGHDDTVQHYL